jgi:hypothetical protein
VLRIGHPPRPRQAVQALHPLTMITLQGNVCGLDSGTIARLPQVERCLLVRVAAVEVTDQQIEWRLPPLAPRAPLPRAGATLCAIPHSDQRRRPRGSRPGRVGRWRGGEMSPSINQLVPFHVWFMARRAV